MAAATSPPRPRHFFVIGAQRCGTSYLYRMLDDHPDVEMARPLRPEPKTFLADSWPASAREYDQRFSDDGAWCKGEKGTSYLDRPDALERILAALPESVFVVILRDPVERALSHHRFSTANGLETLPAAEALGDPALAERPFDPAVTSVSPFAYLPRGRYVEALERVDAAVGAERLHVAVFEELVAGADALAGVYAFLGVDPEHRPTALGTPVNASAGAPEELDAAIRAQLADYFAVANAALEARLGRPLPWARA